MKTIGQLLIAIALIMVILFFVLPSGVRLLGISNGLVCMALLLRDVGGKGAA